MTRSRTARRRKIGGSSGSARLGTTVERLRHHVVRPVPLEARGPTPTPSDHRPTLLASFAHPGSVHDLGEGRLSSAGANGRVQKVLRIAATAAPPNLLGRLLVGSYITGHDQVLITARRGLAANQRAEVHRMADRILGMTVVEDDPSVVEIQNFIDPSKHELPRLLSHVVQLLRAEIEACRAALVRGETASLRLIEPIEEEVDQFYLLMVRQLLLSSESARIARSIDVESHHFQLGYRLVAKVLELTGDLIHEIGVELTHHLTGLRQLPPGVVREIVDPIDKLDVLLARTMGAFAHTSVVEANAILNQIAEVLPKDTALGQRLSQQIPNGVVAVAAERIACHVAMALEMLVVVNEVTINRGVEPETVSLSRDRISMVDHRLAHPFQPWSSLAPYAHRPAPRNALPLESDSADAPS